MSDIKEATQDFNPRLREGGDIVNSHRLVALVISIHASEKDATRNGARLLLRKNDFNPRLREGGDIIYSWFASS